MKKFLKFAFVAISVLFLSQSAFADKNTTSCRVYGAEDMVVTVETPLVKVGSESYRPVHVTLSLTKTTKETIAVSVEVYDSNFTNIGNKTVEIYQGTSKTYAQINLGSVAEPGQMVFVRLSSASCR